MSFKKYPEIERLGHEDNKDILTFGEDTLVIEEKVDGGNGSFWLDDGLIHFGSRNRDLTIENDDKAFARQQIQLREHLENLEKEGVKINPDYIYYFEWMALHTIRYTNVPFIIGLDIRLKRAMNEEGFGLFLGREAREQEFSRLKIENVPLIWRGNSSELKKLNIRELIPKSKYYDGFAEGIVIKNYCRKHPHDNHQLYAKLVRDEFKEDNKAVFGNVRNPLSDTSKIIEEFVTDARIRKAVFKFINEDNMELSLKLMQFVPTYVIKDVLKEEFINIYTKYKFIDFKEMKQKVPKLCLRVINEMLIEQTTLNPNCSEQVFRLTGDLGNIKQEVINMLTSWENEHQEQIRQKDRWVLDRVKEIQQLKTEINSVKALKKFEEMVFTFTCNYETFFKKDNNDLLVATCNNHNWDGVNFIPEPDEGYYEVAGYHYYDLIAEEGDILVLNNNYSDKERNGYPRFIFVKKAQLDSFGEDFIITKMVKIKKGGDNFYFATNNKLIKVDIPKGKEIDKLKILYSLK